MPPQQPLKKVMNTSLTKSTARLAYESTKRENAREQAELEQVFKNFGVQERPMMMIAQRSNAETQAQAQAQTNDQQDSGAQTQTQAQRPSEVEEKHF